MKIRDELKNLVGKKTTVKIKGDDGYYYNDMVNATFLEEDAKYYFETEADYNDLFDTFERVYRRYHDDGIVTTDKNIISAANEFDKKFGLKPIEIL